MKNLVKKMAIGAIDNHGNKVTSTRKPMTQKDREAMMAAERRRLEVYQHFSVKPSNKPLASALQPLVKKNLVLRFVGKQEDKPSFVNMNNFEEQLFMSLEEGN